jgi:diacylglycerol kinase (ATP)
VTHPDRILVILNPSARGERAAAFAGRIKALARGVSVKISLRAGGARDLAATAAQKGFQTVVAAGGDGTVNEVINGLGDADVALGVLPVGTMNVFATELGIPAGNLAKAWNIIQEGHTRLIDVPMANAQRFVQLAGAGLDAEVVRQTPQDSKKALGPVSYILTLAQVAARKPPCLHLSAPDGTRKTGRFVLIGNGRLYGGPFTLFKDAKIDDGLLDVLLFQNQSHWDIIRYLQAIAFGAHPDLHDVEYFQTPALRVECEHPVPFEVDGEIAGTLPCAFSFSPKKLLVFAPRTSARG